MNLTSYSTEELEEELERRKKEYPLKRASVDLTELVLVCDDYFKWLSKERPLYKALSKDDHAELNGWITSIYGEAIKCIYGQEAFRWMERLDRDNLT